MKVNMTPNPLDVVTIHASQGDTEARQWGFELHNNGELIDTSEVTDQIVFKAYKGGTEQLLPENGSVPTTAPFLGDIKYPQGLLTDQEFTYRQSPTESDGLAFVENIKGNTLVWNQILQNGNFESTSGWYSVRGTNAVSNNILSYTSSQIGGGSVQNRITRNVSFVGGHKYLVSVECKPAHATTLTVQFIQGTFISELADVSAVWSRKTFILEPTNAVTEIYIGLAETSTNGYVVGDVDQYRNIQIFDLTQMGLDVTAQEFVSYFPLSYYPYDSGSLLSFNGSGIKTVGKNLLDANIGIAYGGGSGMRWYESQGFMLMANKTYTFSASNTGGASVAVYIIDHATRTALASSSLVTTYTPTQNVIVYFQTYRGAGIPSGTEFQLEIGSQTAYEPYTESVINLPISTYFPSGMKQAGDVYDELTPTKAVTRVGAVDLGSLTWVYESSIPRFYTTDINALIKKPVDNYAKANAISSMYENTTFNQLYATEKKNMTMAFGETGTFSIINTSYTDVNAFKTAMSGVYLYYELATPTETSFTTASLVTENAEIPLSNEDGTLIGKCTEELSSQPGFIDAKIKLTDGDGTCYSNKIQLHVERKPS